MTIEELIKELKKIKGQKKEIYLSIDPEGNQFRTVEEVAFINDEEGDKVWVIWPSDEILDI
ncbi:MAG: hypothetical protein WA057_05250 [Candidatus Magasanikiibacteriota bacterium]